MKYYRVLASEGSELVLWANEQDAHLFTQFYADGWLRFVEPVRVKVVRTDHKGNEYLKSDFPSLMMAPLIMRERAKLLLEDVWEKNGVLVSLVTVDNCRLFAFREQTIDALDMDRSVVVKSRTTRKVILIKEHVFHEGKLVGVDVFRLPNDRGCGFVYVSERFVRLYCEKGLVGLQFLEV